MTLLLGKEPARRLLLDQISRVQTLRKKGISVRLDIILVSDLPESSTYVQAKKKACADADIDCIIHHLPSDISQETLLSLICRLNEDPLCGALICQLPLPVHIDTEAVVRAIDKNKDIDGFHPENLGGLALGHNDAFIPCTPAAILHLLRHYDIPVSGRHVVILGRSRIVGLPLHLLLSQKSVNATVTLCHSQTPDVDEFCRKADILVAAVGHPHLVKSGWISPNTVVVDVGITRVSDPHSAKGYTLRGDVAPDACEKASAFTPVPGGVGPLTVAMVLENCIRAWEKRQ